MEQLVMTVPGMWADHHVTAVRGLFQDDAEVTIVAASAMDATLCLEYDPAATDPGGISARLAQAGYPPGDPPEGEAPPPAKPAWATAGVRVTATDQADLAMSGDHRKY
jgi:hypothetical protein